MVSRLAVSLAAREGGGGERGREGEREGGARERQGERGGSEGEMNGRRHQVGVSVGVAYSGDRETGMSLRCCLRVVPDFLLPVHSPSHFWGEG